MNSAAMEKWSEINATKFLFKPTSTQGSDQHQTQSTTPPNMGHVAQ